MITSAVLFELCAKSQLNVTTITVLETERADYSQGESGMSSNRRIGAKSLRLKILPLSY